MNHHSADGLINLPWDSQRWREGVSSYRPADDERFEPSHHEVVLHVGDGAEAAVNPFVERHHYSGTVPNSGQYRYLLIDTRRPSWAEEGGVVGAAVFGTPSGPQVLSASFPFLTAPSQESLELQRLVLLDEVLKNGESWFVRQCMRKHEGALSRHDVEAVVSFSDPMPRENEEGLVTMPGHVGCVYQALSAWYTGRSKARWCWYLPCGQQINERDLTKVNASCPCCGSASSTSGADGALERLQRWGAGRPRGCRRSWLKGVLPRIAKRRKHPGNHRYVWGLTRAAKRGLRQLHGDVDATRYPKEVGV